MANCAKLPFLHLSLTLLFLLHELEEKGLRMAPAPYSSHFVPIYIYINIIWLYTWFIMIIYNIYIMYDDDLWWLLKAPCLPESDGPLARPLCLQAKVGLFYFPLLVPGKDLRHHNSSQDYDEVTVACWDCWKVQVKNTFSTDCSRTPLAPWPATPSLATRVPAYDAGAGLSELQGQHLSRSSHRFAKMK